MNATQSNLALEVLQGLVDAMNQDEDGDFLLFGSNLPLINQAFAVCGYAPAAVMDKSARNIDILSPGFRREDCPPGESYPDWLNAQLLAAHSEITASLASDQGPRTILVSRPLLEVALANLVSNIPKVAEVHSALYLHLRATRKYEPTYVKTCVPLLDEIWEHLPKDSFAEQRVADAIGGLIEKEPCLQDGPGIEKVLKTLALQPTTETSPMPAPTIQVTCLSCLHLDKETFDMLAKHGDDNDWLVCAVYQDGMFLYIEDLPDTVPQSLRDIRQWLMTHNRLGWVRLDEQFDTVEGLAIYDQS